MTAPAPTAPKRLRRPVIWCAGRIGALAGLLTPAQREMIRASTQPGDTVALYVRQDAEHAPGFAVQAYVFDEARPGFATAPDSPWRFAGAVRITEDGEELVEHGADAPSPAVHPFPLALVGRPT